MPRRPAKVKPNPKKLRKRTPDEERRYLAAVAKCLKGSEAWPARAVDVLTREANRLLGIKRGQQVPGLRSTPPREEMLIPSHILDSDFDVHGRQAS